MADFPKPSPITMAMLRACETMIDSRLASTIPVGELRQFSDALLAAYAPTPQWGPILDALDGLPGDLRPEFAELDRLIRREHERSLQGIDAARELALPAMDSYVVAQRGPNPGAGALTPDIEPDGAALNAPTDAVAWGVIGADGKLLLAEKRGLLAYFDSPPRPLVWGDADVKGDVNG